MEKAHSTPDHRRQPGDTHAAKKTTTCPHSRTRIQVLQTIEKLRTDDNLTEFLHPCRGPLKMSVGLSTCRS